MKDSQESEQVRLNCGHLGPKALSDPSLTFNGDPCGLRVKGCPQCEGEDIHPCPQCGRPMSKYAANPHTGQVERWECDLDDRDHRIEALEKALRFYAEPENWKEIETGIGCHPGPAVDYGETARAALEGRG